MTFTRKAGAWEPPIPEAPASRKNSTTFTRKAGAFRMQGYQAGAW